MKTLTKSLLAIGLLAAASLASAQQGGGRMWGMGRGGGMMGGAMGRAMLLQRDDVRSDLALTDDQKAKLGDIQTKMREKMQGMFSGGERPSREEMGKLWEGAMKEVQTEVDSILTADQQKRLKEISVQLAGNGAVNDKEIAKELAITVDQQRKIEDLQKKSGEAMRTVGQRMRNGEIDREEMRPLMEKIQSVTNDELGKILTDAQKARLKAMGGKPFVKAEGSTR